MKSAAYLVSALFLVACSDVQVVDRPETETPTPVQPIPQIHAIDRTWHRCTDRLRFTDTGRWVEQNLKDGCNGGGTWALEGNLLTRTVEVDECGGGELVGETLENRVHVGPRMMHMFRADGGGAATEYKDESFFRSWFRMSGTNSGGDGTMMHSIVSVLGDLEDSRGLTGCYWSEDLACGGLISCTGQMAEFRFLEDGRFTGRTVCGGDCPCTGVLEGTQRPDGVVEGWFFAASCKFQWDGPFTIQAVETP